MAHKYTAEEKTWLLAQDVSLSYEEVTKRFNEKFGCVVGVSALQQHITKTLGKNHVRKNASDYHFYTEKEKTWLINQDAEITYKELTEKFNEKFNCKRTESQIKDLMCKRLKIVSRTGNIKKGFFTGKEPIYKIGEEVIRDGYVYVKVKDERGENKTNWRRKQDIVWEKENGKIPKNKFVIFLDKNPMNCKIENLYLVNRSIHAQMCSQNFYSTNPQLTIVAIKICELLAKLSEEKEQRRMMNKNEQITMFSIPKGERTDLVKRRWENAFQKWSDEHGMNIDNKEDYGCCGYGAMCDYCKDNSYGRPCVRALNAMCREKGIYLNYASRDFEKVWRGIAESEE